MKIGIIGTGNVGRALGSGLRKKHEVRFGSRDPAKAEPVEGIPVGSRGEVASWAEAVILAVPYAAIRDTVKAIGPDALDGKVLVDSTNAIGAAGLAVGFETSGAEELQRLVPAASVVKAFNTVFAGLMATGTTGDERISLFVAGDDESAKRTVMDLGADIGFDPVDAGPLSSSRYLEPMGMEMIHLAFGPTKMGPTVALRLLRGKA